MPPSSSAGFVHMTSNSSAAEARLAGRSSSRCRRARTGRSDRARRCRWRRRSRSRTGRPRCKQGRSSNSPPTDSPIGTAMLAPGAIAPTKRLRSFGSVSTSSSISRAVWAEPWEWPSMHEAATVVVVLEVVLEGGLGALVGGLDRRVVGALIAVEGHLPVHRRVDIADGREHAGLLDDDPPDRRILGEVRVGARLLALRRVEVEAVDRRVRGARVAERLRLLPGGGSVWPSIVPAQRSSAWPGLQIHTVSPASAIVGAKTREIAARVSARRERPTKAQRYQSLGRPR